MFYEFRFKNNSLSTSKLASIAFSFKTLPMSNSHWQSVGAGIQPDLSMVGGTCCHTVFSQQPLHNSLISTFRDVVSFIKQWKKQSIEQMLNCSGVLKASSELRDWSCRFCSAKKEARQISWMMLLLSRTQLSTDLKFRVSLWGPGHRVCLSLCICRGCKHCQGSPWSSAAGAVGPARPLWPLVLPLLRGLAFGLCPWLI